MSLRYRAADGTETIVSGLTPGGDIEAGAVAERSGNYSLTSSAVGWTKQTIIFDSPLPDDDYTITFEEHSAYGHISGPYLIENKTANGFTVGVFFTEALTNNMSGTYRAFKTYSVQHAAQNAEDIANIKAVIPSTASSTNQLTPKKYVDDADTALDGRVSDLEDLIPTDASVTNQLATKDNIDTVTTNANSRLKVVDIIPSTPANNDVILYTGTETGFRKGGIYQYAATPGTWVLISTADVDLSHYETSFTGTTAEWNALSSTEQNKYDLVSLTDDAESNYQDIYSYSETKTNKVWVDGRPVYRRVYTAKTPTLPSGSSSTSDIVFYIDSTIDRVLTVEGYVEASTGNGYYHMPITWHWNNDIYQSYYIDFQSKGFYMTITRISESNKDVIVILEYVKK